MSKDNNRMPTEEEWHAIELRNMEDPNPPRPYHEQVQDSLYKTLEEIGSGLARSITDNIKGIKHERETLEGGITKWNIACFLVAYKNIDVKVDSIDKNTTRWYFDFKEHPYDLTIETL